MENLPLEIYSKALFVKKCINMLGLKDEILVCYLAQTEMDLFNGKN